MSRYLSDKVVVPRKPHRCSVCDSRIPKGEKCHTYRGIDEDGSGGPVTLYYHLMCWSYTMRWDHNDWFYFGHDTSRREIGAAIIAGEY